MASETILYNALLNSTDITDVVGDRISSDIRIQGEEIPSIWFDKGDTDYSYDLSGSDPVSEKSNYFITCFAQTRESSESLGDDIVLALSGADFIISGREPGYEDETDDYSTTMQASLLEIN